MRLIVVSSLFFISFLSCEPDKKIFVKCIQLKDNARVDWYFHSLITNFSRSYIQVVDSKNDSYKVFESFYISNIEMVKDTLKIQLFKNDYKADSAILQNLKLSIFLDTTGGQWNDAASRLGRLMDKNVDHSNPHFVDTYCPNGMCY